MSERVEGSAEPAAPIGAPIPPTPPDPVRAEIEAAILADTSALGDVWRRIRGGETPDEIASARGAENPNFVWNYRRNAEAILGDVELPTAPTVAQGTARNLRRLMKHSKFSSEALAVLSERLDALETAAANLDARAQEERAALEATSTAEQAEKPGIYVYALPHYLRYPYDPETGHTLLKVGRSDRDVIKRFSGQTRTTALPEDPVLLRIYPTDEAMSQTVERKLHEALEAADHDRSTARTGGTEWFLSTVRFLDKMAEMLDLEIEIVNDLADYS